LCPVLQMKNEVPTRQTITLEAGWASGPYGSRLFFGFLSLVSLFCIAKLSPSGAGFL